MRKRKLEIEKINDVKGGDKNETKSKRRKRRRKRKYKQLTREK